MPVVIHQHIPSDLSREEILRWNSVPVAVAVDVNQGATLIDPAIRPLNPPGRQTRLFGTAVTVRCEPSDIGSVLHALEILEPGDVLVISASGRSDIAYIGEVLSGQARRKGAAGVVLDGAIRDVATLVSWKDMSFFARSITPRGPSSFDGGAINLPVVVGGRLVRPGDLIIGDDDGLAVLSAKQIRKSIDDAEGKLAVEEKWITDLSAGKSIIETFGLTPAVSKPVSGEI